MARRTRSTGCGEESAKAGRVGVDVEARGSLCRWGRRSGLSQRAAVLERRNNVQKQAAEVDGVDAAVVVACQVNVTGASVTIAT